MSRSRILLVEDDAKLGQQLTTQLREAGYEVTWLEDGSAARVANPDDFELLILDLMLPGTFGLDVLKGVRQRSDVPVLILSARDETTTKVRALELGGDDYMTKPFWPEELLARVQARLRRPTAVVDERIVAGRLEIELDSRQVSVEGRALELTRVEFDLLAELARRPNAAIPRDRLAEQILDPTREGTERTLDVHVSRLRRKLGDHAKCVATVWGVGYRFDAGAAPCD
ncbi:MAG: response regulator transcription factor [Planctomycetota bacterium]